LTGVISPIGSFPYVVIARREEFIATRSEA
jgi:hypothetical protein